VDKLLGGFIVKRLVFILLFFILLGICTPLQVCATSNEDRIEVEVDFSKAEPVPTNGTNQDIINFFNDLIMRYKEIVVGAFGLATLTVILAFLVNLTRLGNVKEKDPRGRQNAIFAISMTAIAAMVLGGLTIFFGFFYNGLQ